MKIRLNPKVVIKSPIEIMVGFSAANVVENDCWKEEVAWACNKAEEVGVNPLGTDVAPASVFWYKNAKKEHEAEFKKSNGLKQMPGKYRSAKSVICRAFMNDVELLDFDGNPRGKSEVERDLKAKVAIHASFPDMKALYHANRIYSLWSELTDDGQSKVANLLKPIL